MAFQIWQTLYQFAHFVLKAHFQTLIKLIDDEVLDILYFEITLIDMIIQTSWSTKDNLRHHLSEQTMFIHRRSSTITSHCLYRSMHSSQYIGRLQCKFTTRSNHKRLWCIYRRVNELNQRQKISQRFTATCRRKNHDVLIAMKHCMHRSFLHAVQFYIQTIQYIL